MGKPKGTIRIERHQTRPDAGPAGDLMQACETFLEGVVALREINNQIEELPEREPGLGDIGVSSAHLTKEQRAEYVGILRGMAETLFSLMDDKAANSDVMESVHEFSTDDGEVADLVRLLHARI